MTFWFQRIIENDSGLKIVVFARVLIGAAQGVHFPALASISSKNLNAKDRSFFFSAITAGGAMGSLVTGTIGSYMNEHFGWHSVFYSIGHENSYKLIKTPQKIVICFIQRLYFVCRFYCIGMGCNIKILCNGIDQIQTNSCWNGFIHQFVQ